MILGLSSGLAHCRGSFISGQAFIISAASVPFLIDEQVIECVSKRACVAPTGADQSNHRFDQSVFSIVLARMHIRCHNNWKFNGYLEEDRLHEVTISVLQPLFWCLQHSHVWTTCGV